MSNVLLSGIPGGFKVPGHQKNYLARIADIEKLTKADIIFDYSRINLFNIRSVYKLKDYLKKGQQVFVSGEFTTNEYKANDGTMKMSLELNANIIDLVGKRESIGNANDYNTPAQASSYTPQAYQQPAPAAQPAQNYAPPPQPKPNYAPQQQAPRPAPSPNFDAPYDDDIPF